MPDNSSVRWRGQVQAPATTALTLHVLNDDGARLFLGGKLIADGWKVLATPQEIAGTIDVVAGQRYDVTVEYHHDVGTARARLDWSWPCHAQELVPTRALFPATP
jgi:mannan endo-1,4-beta-mannosidase